MVIRLPKDKLSVRCVVVYDANSSAMPLPGFADMGAVWRYELEMPNIEQTAASLYEEIRPLYEQLHALVRAQLRRYYGPRLVSGDGPIPAHLLGM